MPGAADLEGPRRRGECRGGNRCRTMTRGEAMLQEDREDDSGDDERREEG